MRTHARIEDTEIQRRAVRGVFWSYIAYGVQFLVQSIALVILARQLNLTDFGVFAIGLMIVGVGETIFRLGLGPSLVQLEELRDEHIDVAWTSNLALALVSTTLLTTGTMLCVPDAATRIAVVVMLTSVLLNSVMSPGLFLLQRNVQTRDFVCIATTRVLVRYLGAVLIAIWIPNYWALVSGFVAGFAVEVVMTYLIAKRRPRLLWKPDVFRELFRFSRWLHLKNVLRWGARYLDSLLVGTLLGVPILGLYNRALNLAALPQAQTELLSFRVFYPLFASAQNKPERLARLIRHAVNVLLITSMPVLILMTLHGSVLIRFVLGEKWIDASAVLGVLSVGLLLRSLHDVQATALRAVGNPRTEFLVSAVQVSITGLTLVPNIRYFGLSGAGVALIAGSVAAVSLTWRSLIRELNIDLSAQLGSLGGTLAGAAAAYGVHTLLETGVSSFHMEAISACLEVATFFAVQLLLFLTTGKGIMVTLMWAIRRAADAAARRWPKLCIPYPLQTPMQ